MELGLSKALVRELLDILSQPLPCLSSIGHAVLIVMLHCPHPRQIPTRVGLSQCGFVCQGEEPGAVFPIFSMNGLFSWEIPSRGLGNVKHHHLE